MLAALSCPARAQSKPDPAVLTDPNPSRPGVLACPPGVDFAAEKYRIVRTTLDDPFKFLFLIGPKSKSIEAQLASKLNNQLYSLSLVHEGLDLVEKARFAPDNVASFSVRFERVSLQNCNPAAKTLEVIYRIYSTDPPRFLGGGPESQKVAEKSPQNTAGLTQTGSPFHLTPNGGYDRSNGFSGGGRMQIKPQLAGFHLFNSFTVEGQGSHAMRMLAADVSGSVDPRGPIQHADWRFHYLNYSAPAGATHLSRAGLSGQADLQTRPFWNNTTSLRFGSLLEGGNMQSNVPASLLAEQTTPNAAYGSWKNYVGVSSRSKYNVLAVSYGLELGSVGPSTQIDWRKHIGDVADEFWIPLGDHKPLEVESRFTAGGIQVPHSIPLPARFFGGNGEQFFIPGDAWQILAQPSIRAIPANRFYLTSEGAGAERFTSINLTFSYPVKAVPIMPAELSGNPEFNQLLNSQIVSATSVEQNYYSWKDPQFAVAYAKLPDLKQHLDALQNAVNAAQSAHPGQLEGPFGDCQLAVGTATFDVTNALSAKGIAQYGDLSVLLPVDSDDLKSVQDSCVGELNQQLKDPGINAAAAAVDSDRTAILNAFNGINQKLAAQKAANDIAFVNRTLNTLFKDMNIFSISPVAVFDSAWIGPGKGPLGGNRIGPGAGIRLELASYVNFTLGYAWNVNRQPGEGKGAIFFSIGVRDLFH